ncbi:DivIVA domain-containing protein, partial [Mycobacterium sp. E3247]|uniref:DivIVA domain-containing protein n=2 Tax=Mycobacterium TaxID=1763 RepID=UPI000AB50AFF
VLRGYKTSEVDWVLDRLARELEALRGELAAVHAPASPEGEPEAVEPGDREERLD